MSQQTARPPVAAPWAPVTVSPDPNERGKLNTLHTSDVKALYALSRGEATPEQQQRAFAAIHQIASTDDMSYRPDTHGGERDTIFAEGKRFVGLQMRKIVTHHALYMQDDQ